MVSPSLRDSIVATVLSRDLAATSSSLVMIPTATFDFDDFLQV